MTGRLDTNFSTALCVPSSYGQNVVLRTIINEINIVPSSLQKEAMLININVVH